MSCALPSSFRDAHRARPLRSALPAVSFSYSDDGGGRTSVAAPPYAPPVPVAPRKSSLAQRQHPVSVSAPTRTTDATQTLVVQTQPVRSSSLISRRPPPSSCTSTTTTSSDGKPISDSPKSVSFSPPPVQLTVAFVLPPPHTHPPCLRLAHTQVLPPPVPPAHGRCESSHSPHTHSLQLTPSAEPPVAVAPPSSSSSSSSSFLSLPDDIIFEILKLTFVHCLDTLWIRLVCKRVRWVVEQYTTELPLAAEHVQTRGPALDGIAHVVSCFPNLSLLSLSDRARRHSGFHDRHVCVVASHCRKLEVLNLRGLWRLTADGLRGAGTLKMLHTLDLSGCRNCLNEENIKRLLAQCPCLRSLDVSDAGQVNDACVVAIATALPLLEELYIWNTHVTDESVQVLAERCRRLRTVDLLGCTGVAHYDSVYALLCSCPLEELHVDGLSCVGDQLCSDIRTHCPRMRSLFMQFCVGRVTEAGLACLRECAELSQLAVGMSYANYFSPGAHYMYFKDTDRIVLEPTVQGGG